MKESSFTRLASFHGFRNNIVMDVTPGLAFYIALACARIYVHTGVISPAITETSLNNLSVTYIMQSFI